MATMMENAARFGAGEVAVTFTITDVNPATNRQYRDSFWNELPGPLAVMLTDRQGWDPISWDEHVAWGRVIAARTAGPVLDAADRTCEVWS